MATYKSVVTQILEGVQRQSANPLSQDRIRAVIDASFFSINSQVSEAFAARESNRELLRVSNDISIVSGSATLPSNVLKKYVEDATFVVAATPTKKYSFRRYPQWLRTGDTRLGYWTTIGDAIKVKTPQPVNATPTLTATFTSICSPSIPTTETAEFACPDDFLPDFINAFIQFILGQTADMAAATS